MLSVELVQGAPHRVYCSASVLGRMGVGALCTYARINSERQNAVSHGAYTVVEVIEK